MFKRPREGYCVILHCDETYLPSHAFYGPSFRPRWESDWKIPQGGIVCSDGKWIGFVNDKCDVTAILASVEIYWNKIQGLLTLWDNREWRIASSPPNIRTFRRSCTSVSIHQTRYLRYALTTKSQIKVTCSKLRLTEPNPTPYEGRIEAYNHINGNWEGVCVTSTGPSASSSEICDTLGFNYASSVISISTGWAHHNIACSE